MMPRYCDLQPLLLLASFHGSLVLGLTHPGPAHHCCLGETLRIGYWPASVDVWSVLEGVSEQDGSPMFSGFIPEMTSTIALDMGMAIQPVLCNVTAPNYIRDCQADAIPALTSHDDLNMEFYVSPVIALPATVAIIRKNQATRGVMAVFEPFEMSLWLSIIAFVFLMGGMMAAIEMIHDRDAKAIILDNPLQKIAKYFYQAWSEFLGAETFDWDKKNWSLRVLRFGLLFFILITLATYTANLAAFLTNAPMAMDGPTNMAELKEATVCVPQAQLSAAKALEPFVKKIISPSTEIMLGPLGGSLDWCKEQLLAEDVDAILINAVNAYKYLNGGDNCDTMAIPQEVQFRQQNMAFTFASKTERALNFSRTLLHVMGQPEYTDLAQIYLGLTTCEEEEANDTAALSMAQMGGTFLISAAFIPIAFLVAGIRHMRQKTETTEITELSRNDDLSTVTPQRRASRALQKSFSTTHSSRCP